MEIQPTQQLFQLSDQPMEQSDDFIELPNEQQHHRPLELMDLPTELLYRICKKYLTIRDLLQCRQVNRRSQSICDAIRIKELIIASENSYRYPCYWFMSDCRPIEYNEAVTLEMMIPLASSLELNVKRLFISGYYSKTYLLIQFVNSLSLLEELTICGINFETVIELENLKIIEIFNSSSFNVELRTPKLEYMKLDDLYAEVIYPLSIKHLVLDIHDPWIDVINKIESMANLEHLEFFSEYYCYDWLVKLVGKDLSTTFPNLKKLMFYFNDLHYLTGDDFLTQWIKRSKRSFKIYANCVELVELVDLDSLSTVRSCDSSLHFQLINYNHLVINDSLDYFDYSVLESVLDKKPRDFFDKFPAIRFVDVTGKIKYSEEFFWFLKNARKLKELGLYRTELDQTFFDQLPPLDDLEDLRLLGESERSLNWDFILRLANLVVFVTDSPVNRPFQLACQAFKQLNRLKRLDYYGDGLNFYIKRENGRYSFLCKKPNGSEVFYSNDIDQIRLEFICEMLDCCRDWSSLHDKILKLEIGRE